MNAFTKWLNNFDLDKFMKQGVLPIIGLGFVLLIATFLGPLGSLVGLAVIIGIAIVAFNSLKNDQ